MARQRGERVTELREGARYDLLVVGGGINGAGIARDAAGRGLAVLLVEQDDLAAHTSSSSTKLIHGGLRYLEYKEFSLVRKALKERETLLRAAPHIIRPLRFVMPHMPNLRPAWLIRAGLFLYDHLARRELLPGSRGIVMRRHPAGAPLVDSIERGFVYSDGWVDDARLVVLNALDASERGAAIETRTKLVRAVRAGGEWQAELERADGTRLAVRARALANAAGPWVGQLLHEALGRGAQHTVRLVKGSHIVTRRLFEHDHAYIFQNPDKRIIFAIPYEREFTLIGTTDVEYHDDPARVAIDDAEIRYLCESINRYFKRKIAPADVCWSYSGVRPLLEEEGAADPSAVTRDYRLELDTGTNASGSDAPLLSVFGGKITTFRKLAEEAVDLLGEALDHRAPGWTAGAALPGGDIANGQFDRFAARFASGHPWLPAELVHRYARAYGTRAERMIGEARSVSDLGAELAPGLYERELAYLSGAEWARCADDVLWRRSKLGLHLAPGTLDAVRSRIDTWFTRSRSRDSASRDSVFSQ
ncbi:glycerol-3-phosphate dehydrogenase [Trinickia symbiotica]|uniref:glycerol-3-phosphate dehydrogenase n=1 Tax=Trinickia symbiotica TaxID=863227 RepID=UPI003F79970F